MPGQQIVIDIGPNFLTFLLALIAACSSAFAAYHGLNNARKIDDANGNLARALVRQSAANVAADKTQTGGVELPKVG